MKKNLLQLKKTYWVFATATILFAACKKEVTTPPVQPVPVEMELTNLNDREIKINNSGVFIDLNKDGRKDVFFGTLLVGDPIHQQDKWQFLAMSDFYTNLPVNRNEEIPVMNNSSRIPLNNFNGCNWYNASAIVLVQKVISLNIPDYWEGHWKEAVNKYLPVQVMKNNLRYNGWVELTVDIANEKIILHRAAISRQAEREINAGNL